MSKEQKIKRIISENLKQYSLEEKINIIKEYYDELIKLKDAIEIENQFGIFKN